MNKLQEFCASKPFGFLKDTDMPALIEMDRLCPVLVRCGSCRFTCAAQDLEHLKRCIKAGGDYVRDVSFAAGIKERAEKWHEPHVAVASPAPVLTQSSEPLPKSPWKSKAPEMPWWRDHFNEADCGGVFDGREVVSDADPGL